VSGHCKSPQLFHDAIVAGASLGQYASACIKLPHSQLQLGQLDAPLIVNFLNHLEISRGNGAGSRNTRLAAIKSFMHHTEYRVPSALEQIQRILAIPTVRDGIRDRAMLLSTGFHAPETRRP
jgi:hypothetical protein